MTMLPSVSTKPAQYGSYSIPIGPPNELNQTSIEGDHLSCGSPFTHC